MQELEEEIHKACKEIFLRNEALFARVAELQTTEDGEEGARKCLELLHTNLVTLCSVMDQNMNFVSQDEYENMRKERRRESQVRAGEVLSKEGAQHLLAAAAETRNAALIPAKPAYPIPRTPILPHGAMGLGGLNPVAMGMMLAMNPMFVMGAVNMHVAGAPLGGVAQAGRPPPPQPRPHPQPVQPRPVCTQASEVLEEQENSLMAALEGSLGAWDPTAENSFRETSGK